MNTINLTQTATTPRVLFDAERGVLVIGGRSIMEDSRSFYQPLIEWINEYIEAPRNTSIVIDLEYFNTPTNKFLQSIFYILGKNRNRGYSTIVYWIYDKDDEDIWESGHEFSNRSQIEFVYLARINYAIERLKIDETDTTPKVDLDPVNAILDITGYSNQPDLRTFYMPLIEWLSIYIKEPQNTSVNINLRNINATTSRFLQIFFTMLSEIKYQGFKVLVNWFYSSSDEESLNLGKEYSSVTGLNFNFINKSEI